MKTMDSATCECLSKSDPQQQRTRRVCTVSPSCREDRVVVLAGSLGPIPAATPMRVKETQEGKRASNKYFRVCRQSNRAFKC